MIKTDAGYGVQCNERTAVVVAVVIRAFHERALWIEVANLEIGADRRIKIAEDSPAGCMISECSSIWLQVIAIFSAIPG